MGDYSEYIRGKIAERGPQNAKFEKDGFDRWAENTYPARIGQVDKVPTEMPTSTEAPSGGRLYKKHMSLQHKMRRHRKDSSSMSGSDEEMCGGGTKYVEEFNGRFYVVEKTGKKFGSFATKEEAEAAVNTMNGGGLDVNIKHYKNKQEPQYKFVLSDNQGKVYGKYANIEEAMAAVNTMNGGAGKYYVQKMGPHSFSVMTPSGSFMADFYTQADAENSANAYNGGSFLSALKKGAKVVGKYATKAAKFVHKHKDTIKEGIKMAREYAPVVRDVYHASKTKEGRKALLDAALGSHEAEADAEPEAEGGRRHIGGRRKHMTPLEHHMGLHGPHGGSFLSALKKGAKVVGKYATKAAKFVHKHKDTIKEGVKLAREYAPVVRDVYHASKTKEGRKALLDAALGSHEADAEAEPEAEGGRSRHGLTRHQEQIILHHGGAHGGSILAALKKGAKVVGKYATKAAKFVHKHQGAIKEGVKLAREYAPVVRDVYHASKTKEGRKALLDAALGSHEAEPEPEAEGGRRRRIGGAYHESRQDPNEERKREAARRGGAKKPSARGAIVSKVMKEMGLSLPQASKYVKEHGLY